MSQITFPKIEIEPADLDRLEAIVARFEKCARSADENPCGCCQNAYNDIMATSERQIKTIVNLRAEIEKAAMLNDQLHGFHKVTQILRRALEGGE